MNKSVKNYNGFSRGEGGYPKISEKSPMKNQKTRPKACFKVLTQTGLKRRFD
jgi:hypothetical protein